MVLRLSVYPSVTNQSSTKMAAELVFGTQATSTDPTLCCKVILILSLEIRVLPCGTLCLIQDFASACRPSQVLSP